MAHTEKHADQHLLGGADQVEGWKPIILASGPTFTCTAGLARAISMTEPVANIFPGSQYDIENWMIQADWTAENDYYLKPTSATRMVKLSGKISIVGTKPASMIGYKLQIDKPLSGTYEWYLATPVGGLTSVTPHLTFEHVFDANGMYGAGIPYDRIHLNLTYFSNTGTGTCDFKLDTLRVEKWY
jgi:hypothetical protein